MRVDVYGILPGHQPDAPPTTPNGPAAEYVGIQLFVGPDFKITPADAAAPAVVFWYHNGYERGLLREALQTALKQLDEHPPGR